MRPWSLVYAIQFLSYRYAWEKRKTKIEISHSIFLTVTRINRTLGVSFTSEQLRVFNYMCIRVSHHLLCLSGAASILTGCHFEPTQSLLKKYYHTSWLQQNLQMLHGSQVTLCIYLINTWMETDRFENSPLSQAFWKHAFLFIHLS